MRVLLNGRICQTSSLDQRTWIRGNAPKARQLATNLRRSVAETLMTAHTEKLPVAAGKPKPQLGVHNRSFAFKRSSPKNRPSTPGR